MIGLKIQQLAEELYEEEKKLAQLKQALESLNDDTDETFNNAKVHLRQSSLSLVKVDITLDSQYRNKLMQDIIHVAMNDALAKHAVILSEVRTLLASAGGK